MTRTTDTIALGITGTITLALAACSPAPDHNGNSVERPTEMNMAVPAPSIDTDGDGNGAVATTGNDAVPAKSILRPEIVAPEPAPPPLEPIDRIVPFAQPGRTLDDEGRRALDALLADPITRAGGPITLSGHSDSRGNDRDNLRMSRQRAEAVRDYLIAEGIDPTRITVIALGETRPLVPNAHPDGSDDPAARARNRRVEVAVALPAPPEAVATPRSTDGNRMAAAPTR